MTSMYDATHAIITPLWASFTQFIYAHFFLYYTHPVGTTYLGLPSSWNLFASPDSRIIFLGSLVYCFFALLVGYKFLRCFTKTLRPHAYDHALLLLAGFMPGFLILIATNRLVTFLLPNQWAFPALLVIYLTALELEMLEWCKAQKHHWKKVTSVKDLLIMTLSAMSILSLFLIVQMETGSVYATHVIGDAVIFYLELMHSGHGFGATEYFPIITRHYDEILFLYPLIKWFPPTRLHAPLEFYWVMYGFGKAACFAIAALSIAALSRSRWIGVLVAALLFFGSIHPNPLADYLLFDSGNPLAICMHIARVFLAILPLALIALAIRYPLFLQHQYNKFDIFLLLLLCVGFSSLSINAITLVVFSVATALLARWSPPAIACTFIALLLVLAMCALYSSILPFYAGDARYFIVGSAIFFLCVLAIGVIGVKCAFPPLAATARNYMRRVTTPNTMLIKNSLFIGGIFIGVTVPSILFLGNIFVERVYTALHIVGREFLPGGGVASPTTFGVNPLCNIYPLNACDSIISFGRAYGLPFIVTGLGSVFALRKSCSQPSATDEFSLAWASTIVLALLLFSFFVIDFMNGDPFYSSGVTFIWVKTRLAEPWFYTCLALGIAVLWNHSGRYIRPIIIVLLLIYIFLRHALSPHGGIAGQALINARYLAAHLF